SRMTVHGHDEPVAPGLRGPKHQQARTGRPTAVTEAPVDPPCVGDDPEADLRARLRVQDVRAHLDVPNPHDPEWHSGRHVPGKIDRLERQAVAPGRETRAEPVQHALLDIPW